MIDSKGTPNLAVKYEIDIPLIPPLLIFMKTVDTIKCQSEVDLTKNFFEKLLLGAIDKRGDHEKMEAQAPKLEESSHAQEQPLSTLSHRLLSIGKGKERRFSDDDDTLVGSSTRWNSFPTVAIWLPDCSLCDSIVFLR